MTIVAAPKYRHYKPKNLAVVRLDGHDCYLGTYGSPESWEKYHRLLAGRLSAKPAVPVSSARVAQPLTISELLNRYRIYAETYYAQEGRQTKEFVEMKYAARPLRALYGGTLAAAFGPLALKAVREHMVTAEDLSRNVANHRINRIKRIFKWAVSEELIPPSVYESIRTVDGLRYGRTNARETDPVKPVALEHVTALYEHVAPQVAAMIRVQLLTAMRPCEVVAMRRGDIDTSDAVWQYKLEHHKNRWRGLSRVIPLGPQAQELLKPFMDRSPNEYLFSPREAETHRNAKRRTARQTPLTPSQRKRGPKPTPKRAKRERYDVASYRRAITYGIKKANRTRTADNQIPPWYPLQLCHARATELRRQFGLEAAQVVLGHARADVTQVYAERNLQAAIEIARNVG